MELRLALVHGASNRRGTRWLRRATERDVAFTGEQARRRIETNPTRAGQIDFAPRVQVCEIEFSATRPVERFHVRRELNEVAGNKTRRETHRAKSEERRVGKEGRSRWS